MARARALSSPRLETAREKHWMLFRNGFLVALGLELTQGRQGMDFQEDGGSSYSRLGFRKLPDEFICIYVIFVDLRVVHRGVALPSYKILLLFPSAKELLFQDGLNFPFRHVVNNVRWWFKKIWSVFIGFFVWG